jgi:hypothetical protein
MHFGMVLQSSVPYMLHAVIGKAQHARCMVSECSCQVADAEVHVDGYATNRVSAAATWRMSIHSVHSGIVLQDICLSYC